MAIMSWWPGCLPTTRSSGTPRGERNWIVGYPVTRTGGRRPVRRRRRSRRIRNGWRVAQLAGCVKPSSAIWWQYSHQLAVKNSSIGFPCRVLCVAPLLVAFDELQIAAGQPICRSWGGRRPGRGFGGMFDANFAAYVQSEACQQANSQHGMFHDAFGKSESIDDAAARSVRDEEGH